MKYHIHNKGMQGTVKLWKNLIRFQKINFSCSYRERESSPYQTRFDETNNKKIRDFKTLYKNKKIKRIIGIDKGRVLSVKSRKNCKKKIKNFNKTEQRNQKKIFSWDQLFQFYSVFFFVFNRIVQINISSTIFFYLIFIIFPVPSPNNSTSQQQ